MWSRAYGLKTILHIYLTCYRGHIQKQSAAAHVNISGGSSRCVGVEVARFLLDTLTSVSQICQTYISTCVEMQSLQGSVTAYTQQTQRQRERVRVRMSEVFLQKQSWGVTSASFLFCFVYTLRNAVPVFLFLLYCFSWLSVCIAL